MPSATTDRRRGLTADKGMKAPVDVATLANIVLSGEQTIDGFLTASSRVLVKNQTDATTNGFYDSNSGPWTRCIDSNGNGDLVKGQLVGITGGAQAGTYWHITSANPITLGSSPIVFAQDLTNTTAALSAALAATSGSSLVGFIQAGAGATARLLQAKARDLVSVLDFGAVADGNFLTGAGTDNTAAFQAAINSLSTAGGGALFVPAGIYKLASQITVPSGISVFGTGKWSSMVFAPTAFANANGLIAMNGVGGAPTDWIGVSVIAQLGGAGGYGIVNSANGSFISDVWINGFSSGAGIRLTSTDQFVHDFAIELCSNGIQCLESHQNISHGTLFSNGTTNALISNNASVDCGPVIFTGIRATGPVANGFVVSGGKNVIFNGCSATHNNNTGLTTEAFSVESGSAGVTFSGCIAKILGTISVAGIGYHVSGSSDVIVNGCRALGFAIGLKIQGASTGVQVDGCSLTGNTLDASILDTSSGVRWGSNTVGTFSEATPASIASAAALTLPVGPDQIVVTGTTAVTSIVATGNARRTVTLQFAGILTFTDGSNLKLAGNFVTTADDTITLYCDGTNWFELARSVN